MKLWIATNASLDSGKALEASATQNVLTAMALADAGARVLLWVAAASGDARPFLAEWFGREVPDKLRIIAAKPKGREGQKRTQFSSPTERLKNIARGRLKAPPPEAIISRSPLALSQLRASSLIDPSTRLILEYQYPEYIMLWRGWRAKKPDASLSDCRRILRSLRRSEFEWMSDADGVLYAARGHERLLDRIPFTNKPRRWLPTACPPPDSASPAAADDSPRAYDLGYAGSLAPDNGLDTLLAALQNIDGATLCLIGGGKGKYVRRLQQTVQALGLDHRVTFTGKVPFAEVRPRMRQCRIGIAPISARCGPEKRKYASPLKLVEWMAAGVPVVASTVPSVTQHVADGREAALVRPDSPSELAAAIKNLLTNAEARAKLAKAGRAFAEQSSYSIRAQRILNFVEELIRRRP